MTFDGLKSYIEGSKYRLSLLSENLQENRNTVSGLRKDIDASDKVMAVIQRVAKETQKQIEYQISSLVSLSLKSVFHRPYQFKAEFVERRGKTECDLFFEKDGTRFEYDEVGGGVLDVAAFALRVSLWAIQNPRSRALFILDEPFKNINDPKRILHRKVAEMVKMISEMVKVQIIIISTIPEMEEVANKVFTVMNRRGKSSVETDE